MSAPPEIGLLMSTGMSLQAWERTGFLDRELGIYRRLAERLHARVVFVSYGGPEEVDYLRGERCFGVVPKQLPRLSDLAYSLAMGPALRSLWSRLSLLKTNQMRGAWGGLFPRRAMGLPLVIRCGYEWLLYAHHGHEQLLGRRRPLYFAAVAAAEALVYHNADAVMLPGREAARFVERRLHVPSRKIHVFGNSIDLHRFRPRPELLPIPGRVAFVGRLEAVKQLDLLLRALRQVEGAELVVVGEGPDRKLLERLAREMGVRTRFYGRVPNQSLPEVLCQSQAFVLPSLKEGNPKALMEAMACGRPCVATDAPGSRDLIEHGRSGLLVPHEAEAMAGAVRRVLAEPDLAARLGSEARAYAETAFDLEANLDREARLLRGLMRRGATAGLPRRRTPP